MTRFITISALLIFVANALMAQQKVVLQQNGTAIVFSGTQPYVDAYNAAANGDTLYLPGIRLTTPHINKKLVIFGTGHYPDSTLATGKTIVGGFTIQENASGSHFEGLHVDGGITFDTNKKIDNVTIRRCHINDIINIAGTGTNNCDNVVIQENVIRNYIYGNNAVNPVVQNNIIGRGISAISRNGWIANNIIMGNGSFTYSLTNISQCFLENNIISSSYYAETNVIHNTFHNNVFNYNPTASTLNNYSGNFVNVDFATLFVNYVAPFDYAANYHLQQPASYKGTTDNEVGIFGGLKPYKEGAMPVNPHISEKSIAPKTDEEGKLNVTIKVNAQTR
jgi:hypothetical protein